MSQVSILFLFFAFFHLGKSAEAGIADLWKGDRLSTYAIRFPDRVIAISGSENNFVVSEQQLNGEGALSLFNVKKIRSISKFESSPDQKKWPEYIVKSAEGELENPSTWLLIGTDRGYQILRRRFKRDDIVSKSLFHVFTLSGDGTKPEKVSVGHLIDPVGGMHFLFSIKPKNGPGQTLIVRETDLEQRLVANHFIEISPTLEQGRLQISNDAIKFKSGDTVSLGLKPIDVAHLPGDTLVKANPKTTTAVKPPNPDDPAPATAAEPKTAGEVPQSQVVEASYSEFVYNDINFGLSIEPNGPDKGTFIIRKKDNLRIKISAEALSTTHEKIKVDQGVFSFSRARKIDLDKFNAEASMQWVPQVKATQATTSSGQPPPEQNLKVNDPIAEDTFEDYRELPRLHIPPIAIRESLISTMLGNISLPKAASTILTGESGDIADIVAEAINRMPRTWKILVLDSASFGAGLGISGAKEQKVLAMEQQSKDAITIFYAEDFETFKGLGAVSGDSRDALAILRKPVRNGRIRIIGTGRDDFKQKVADPGMIQAMQVMQVEALTPNQVVEAITQWMRHQPRFAGFDYSDVQKTADYEFNPVAYLMRTSRNFNVSEMEPNRSIKLLEKAKLPLTRESIDLAAQELFRLHSSIIERKAKFQMLNNLIDNLNENILGHSHLKENLQEQTDKFLTMQHDRKGPAVRLWLEGPPGVGKTELAKAYAIAMGLEYDVIEMATIVNQDQLMTRIRNQLDRHPFSVLIFDEVDKAKDKSVYEAMLTMMNQETFTYTEQTGDKKTYTLSAANSKVVVTSNLTDDLVADFLNSLPIEDRDMNEAELARRFFETHSISTLIEHMVQKGMPRPFIDRFMTVENGISYAFPPSTNVMVKLLEYKLKSGHKAVQSDWGVEILLRKATEFCRDLAKKYREQNLSTRTTLGILQTEVTRLRGKLYKSDSYSPGSRYELDLLSGHHSLQNSCKFFYQKH